MTAPRGPDPGPALEYPGRFLLAFTALAGLLMLAWEHLSAHYLAGLAAAANAVLSLVAVPLHLGAPAASGHDLVHPLVVGAVALFAATPGRRLGWRLRWTAVVLVGLFLTHTGALAGQGYAVYAASIDPGGSGTVAGSLAQLVTLRASSWAALLAVVGAWFYALGRRPS